MDMLAAVYSTHPFWIWILLGVVLLGAEAATGSGWLLWPAASAMVVAVITVAGIRLGAPLEIVVFAILTIITTFLARRYLIRMPGERPDINDQQQRLLGKVGVARTAFTGGHGRAFVNGAEWPAELENGDTLEAGAKVVVTAIDGSRLTIRPA